MLISCYFFGTATSLGEGKHQIQTSFTSLKHWPCVTSCGGLGKYTPPTHICQYKVEKEVNFLLLLWLDWTLTEAYFVGNHIC